MVPTSAKPSRIVSIDIARAFTITLVTLYHFIGPQMTAFFQTARNIFHISNMPVFMFISGFIFMLTYKPVPYFKYVSKKFKRLMIPYLATSLIIIYIKIAMSGVMPMDNPVTLSTFLTIFYSPSAGYFLWFMWAIWWIMLIIPLFNTPSKRMTLFVVALILHFFYENITPIFCLNEFANYLVFFCSGTVVYDFMHSKGITTVSRKWQAIGCTLYIVLVTLVLILDLPKPFDEILLLATSFSGVATMLTLSKLFSDKAPEPLKRMVLSISASTFIVYLFHTTFQGFAKGALNMMHFLEGDNLDLKCLFAIIVGIFFGVIIPWLISVHILTRFRITRFLFALPAPKPTLTQKSQIEAA